jgi:6-phosphofructokinase
MNAALRAVVRTALSRSVAVYAIEEGYQGMSARAIIAGVPFVTCFCGDTGGLGSVVGADYTTVTTQNGHSVP